MKKLVKYISVLLMSVFFLILIDTNLVSADTINIKDLVEARGYYYFDTKEEAYDYVKNYVNSVPGKSLALSDYIIDVAYKGDFDDYLFVDSLIYSDLDLLGYDGNRAFDDIYKASTKIIIQSVADDYLSGEGIAAYQVCNTWRTKQMQNEGLTEAQWSEAIGKAQSLADSFNYGSDYEKAKRAYEYICDNTSYDNSERNASMYSALCEHSSICTGFAQSFFQICKDMGLNCLMVHSPGYNREGHAYDLIELDGAWYIADLTQDYGCNHDDYRAMFIGTESEAYMSNITSYGDNSLIGVDISYYDYNSNDNNYDVISDSDNDSNYDDSYDDFDFDTWYQDIMSEAETINEYNIIDNESRGTINTSDTVMECATNNETTNSAILYIFLFILGIFAFMSTVGVIVIAIISSKHE